MPFEVGPHPEELPYAAGADEAHLRDGVLDLFAEAIEGGAEDSLKGEDPMTNDRLEINAGLQFRSLTDLDSPLTRRRKMTRIVQEDSHAPFFPSFHQRQHQLAGSPEQTDVFPPQALQLPFYGPAPPPGSLSRLPPADPHAQQQLAPT